MQKTILRNGLIAALFAFIMVICLMPQNASAIVQKEAPGGKLDGFIYSFDQSYTEEAVVYELKQVKVNDETLPTLSTSVNLEEYYKAYKKQYAEDGDDCNVGYVEVCVVYEDSNTNESRFEVDFTIYDFDAQATLSEVAQEDVTFEYEVKAIVDDSQKKEATIEDTANASLGYNKITVKKGSLVSEVTKLVLVTKTFIKNYKRTIEDMYVIREKANDYGLPKSTEEYGVVNIEAPGVISEYIYGVLDDEERLKDSQAPVVGFSNFGGSEGFVKEANALVKAVIDGELDDDEIFEMAKVIVDKLVLLNGKDETKLATFSHKGVNTADNADLALWIAIFAIAAVAGGAVALKRN